MANPIDNDGLLIAQAQPNNQTVFTTQTPSIPSFSDGGASYELGMKFRSSKAGQITAIRFWKAANETGVHTGRIWTANGSSVLASVTFSNETASGWQQQALATPLIVQANTTYVVSVNINSYYAVSLDGLASSITNQDLSSVADGNNGVFANPSNFPTGSYRNSNYFRDVVFAASVPATINKVGGDRQTGTAASALANPLVVQVNDTAGNPQSGARVTFAVTNGGGSVSPTSAVTGANGRASTVLTLGSTAGSTNTVSATAANIGSVTFYARANSTANNAIYLENQKTGTTNWKITNQVTKESPEIVGYATATSVNKGGSLPVKVSLPQSGGFTIDVYRLGYYGGTGGRLVLSSGQLNGITQPECVMTDTNTRLIECNWSTSYTIAVGNDWTSGLYIAKLTAGQSGKQSQVWFVVRDDSSTSDLVFQSSFTTYLAYNNTGGYSTYAYNSLGGQRAFKVSYDRPFSMTTIDYPHYNKVTVWEYNLARWLESQGYDVSYVTNMDVHTNPQLLRQHKVFLSVGHDEYWSLEERNGVEQARDAGVNLAFFSSNSAYWRVRFENGSVGGTNRVMACYKDAATASEPTDKYRRQVNNRPENALLGVMYNGDRDNLYNTWDNIYNPTYGGYDFVITNSNDPYYANTGLNNGDKLTALVGFEWDATFNNGAAPSGLVVLADSPVNATHIDDVNGNDQNTSSGTLQTSNAVRYTAASGAKVFSTGSMQWMWALDSDGVTPNRTDRRAKQIAINVMADMGVRPVNPDIDLIVP